jgi:molybdopterin/thiamine biosynthesis adenylyltransferase
MKGGRMEMETWLDCYLQQSGSLLEVVIIGLGGIGCVLAEHVSRILAFSSPFREVKIIKVILIDGDAYQFRNSERQNFDRLGNKAIVQAELLSKKFPRILFGAIPRFVGEKNSEKEIAVESVVKENRIIFVAPDNGKTRKLVNDHCATLKNVVLISGGNDIVDGCADVYLRGNGKDITPPLTYMNPSVSEPKDKSPAEMGCAELMESKPQLYLANLDVAQSMLILFYSLVNTPINKGLPFFRLFSDTLTGKRRVVVNDQPFNN